MIFGIVLILCLLGILGYSIYSTYWIRAWEVRWVDNEDHTIRVSTYYSEDTAMYWYGQYMANPHHDNVKLTRVKIRK